jgi:hypothetical protein
MDPEKLYMTVGKLYLDIVSLQSVIDSLQKKLSEKDNIIRELQENKTVVS